MRRSCLVLGVLLLAACSESPRPEENGLRIVDQSGAEFLWVCGERLCDVHRIAGFSAPDPRCDELFPDSPGLVPEWEHAADRFIGIYAHCDDPRPSESGMGISSSTRFLVCDGDEDCPAVPYSYGNYECRAGFCQTDDFERHPQGLPNNSDMYTLCIGDEQRDAPEVEQLGETKWAEIQFTCQGGNGGISECQSIPEGCPDPR